MRASLAVLVVIIAGAATPARAHQSSVKYVDVTVDGRSAAVRFTVAPGDVSEALGLEPDARPTVGDVLTPGAASYVTHWLSIATAPGSVCAAADPTAAPDPDGKLVIVRWRVTCDGELDAVSLDLSRLFEVDRRHEAVVTVHRAGQLVDPVVVRADRPRVTVEVGTAGSWLDWVALGMHHIYSGTDHVCFLLALLLVVVLRRGDGGWQLQSPMRALRATAMIVTAFTLAHSVTLIAAALGWVRLPSRLVESAIAGSIVYTAVENVVRPHASWRALLALGFGLIHGLGFAAALEQHLPPAHVIAPLVGFNVGVELGQLTIVAIAGPLCWGIARSIGPDRYRRYALAVAAAPLVLVGIKWLIERASGA